MGIDPKSWAETFAAELTVAGERVPFDRVLARHLDTVTTLRTESGLTWRSLSSLLSRAGVRRADGRLISLDQIRVSYARLTRVASAKDARAVASSSEQPGRSIPQEKPSEPLAKARTPRLRLRPDNTVRSAAVTTRLLSNIDDDEVSSDDIAVALARLNKLPTGK